MNRRDFLQSAAATTFSLAAALGATELRAEPADDKKEEPAGPPVPCAVIGINTQGREMLKSLAKLGATKAPVVAICDTFESPVFVKKANDLAPSAKFQADYRRILEDKNVQAIFVATPSHKHKQIVLDALQAGKHVYCEAPLATDLAEAKDIAVAGMNAKTVFQPGLQVRSNAQAIHVYKFIRSKVLGTVAFGRAQYHQRPNLGGRQQYPIEARQNELNWRLSKATSSGLPGEVGIHQIDTAAWYFDALPLAVTGFGGIMGWKDGRDVPDTVQCILEFPNNVNYIYDASLVTSYEDAYEMFFGSGSAIQLRDQRAWMFKESDANDIGWETFARKDDMNIGVPANGTGIKLGSGIALVADASKQLALGKEPGKMGTDVSRSSLYQAIENFIAASAKNGKPPVSALQGYQATVVANKCHEAALNHTRIEFKPEWFAL